MFLWLDWNISLVELEYLLAQMIWVLAPTLPISTSLAVGKSFSLSMLEFPYLLNTLQQVMDLPDILQKINVCWHVLTGRDLEPTSYIS